MNTLNEGKTRQTSPTQVLDASVLSSMASTTSTLTSSLAEHWRQLAFPLREIGALRNKRIEPLPCLVTQSAPTWEAGQGLVVLGEY